MGACLTLISCLLMAGCEAQQPAASEGQWLQSTVHLLDDAVSTVEAAGHEGADGSAPARTLFVPVEELDDRYAVATALIGLGPGALDAMDASERAAVVDSLNGSYGEDDTEETSVGPLYVASQVLRADRSNSFLTDGTEEALVGAIEGWVRAAPDYADHVDAAVALDALREHGGAPEDVSAEIVGWTDRVAATVCAPGASALDLWIATAVPELRLPCTAAPSASRCSADAERVTGSLLSDDRVTPEVCEEARWLARAASSRFSDDPDIAAGLSTLADAASGADRFDRLTDPLLCGASLAEALSVAGKTPSHDGMLTTYLKEVAIRGGEPIRLTLSSYQWTRLVIATSMLGGQPHVESASESFDERVVLEAVVGSGDVPPDGWQATVADGDTGVLLHLLEAVLASDDTSAACGAARDSGLTAHAYEATAAQDGVGLLLAAMAVRVDRVCGSSGSHVQEALAQVRQGLASASSTETTDVGALWLQAALTCLVDPEDVQEVLPEWDTIRSAVEPSGGAYLDGALDPMSTYYAASLLTASPGACVTTGLLTEGD